MSIPSFIIRHLTGLVFRLCQRELFQTCFGLITYCPQDTAFYKLKKSGISKSSFIMTKSGVKNATLSIIPHPGIRLPVVSFNPLHQNGNLIADLVVNICFIPFGGKGIDTLRSEEHTSELQSLMRTQYAVLSWTKTRQQPKL